MASNPEEATVYLDLIAAKAAQLSNDIRRGALWDGDLHAGLDEIQNALRRAQVVAGH